MNKCLIVINRPVHIIYFHNILSKNLLPSHRKFDFFVNQAFSTYVLKAAEVFKLPIGEIYAFEEPEYIFESSPKGLFSDLLPHLTIPKWSSLVKAFFKYHGLLMKIKKMNLHNYKFILTFADDMLHFQFLLFNYKRKQKNKGLIFLADEGIGLYYQRSRRHLVRELFKKLLFSQYRTVQLGCNSLTDFVFARIPEKCNCADMKEVKKIDYQIQEKVVIDKWYKVFEVDKNKLENVFKTPRNDMVLFLGAPFEEIGICHDDVIEFLWKMKEFEKVDVVIKPHPKEDYRSYKTYFSILPAEPPAELFLGTIRFKFVLSYYSSALIEAKLYNQETFYVDFASVSGDVEKTKAIFKELGIKQYDSKKLL